MRWAAAWLSGWRPYLLLLCLCMALYLPGLTSIPPLDRDEARFAQATRQMLETGDFLRIRFQEEARNKKPAGIYWLQAAAVDAFSTPQSTAIWPYRLPSVAAALLAAVLVFAFGKSMFAGAGDPLTPRRIALIAATLLASALGVVAEAHIAKTDAALLAALTAGQGALGLAYVRERTGRPVGSWVAAAFWAAEIAAVFLKGPVGPALAIATILALWIVDGRVRWVRNLRPVLGILALVAVLAPWVIAIERATEGQFIADSLGKDFMLKLIGAQESHGAPPFSYLLMAFATFWPASLLLAPAVIRGWCCHNLATERFLLAWISPAWIFLELVPTKLPHYALPLYPPLALLAAAALVEGSREPGRWTAKIVVAGTALWVVVGLALAAVLIALPLRFGGQLFAAGLAGALLLLVLTALVLIRGTSRRGIAVLIAALSLAFVVPVAVGVLPRLEGLWLSRAAAGLVAAHPPAGGMPLVAVGYGEPSLVFLLGTGLRITTPGGAADALATGGEALVGHRDQPMFLQALAARGLSAQPLGSVRGLDYSNGQHLVLTLFDVRPD